MTPEERAQHQNNVKAVIGLLQTLHDGLDITEIAEPDGICSYCGLVFDTSAIATGHVHTCEKNPFVKEIERLEKLVKTAYREGGQEGRKTTHTSYFDEDNRLWDHSEARKALEQP